MRKKVTVPAAGERQEFAITGRAIIIEACPEFRPETLPVLSFEDAGDNKPIYLRHVYNAGGQQFHRVVITGTAESAGAEIWLFSTNDCLKESFGDATGNLKAIAGETLQKTTGDTPATLDAVDYIKDEMFPVSMYLSAHENDVVFSFDSAPNQSGNGHLLKAGETLSLEILGIDFIEKFQYMSAVSTSPATLNITFRY